MPSRHDWADWDNYQAVHAKWLADYDFFLQVDTVRPLVVGDAVFWTGAYRCASGIEIHITKQQAVRLLDSGRPQVRTHTYSYHVLQRLPDDSARSLFRYDNIHVQPGHPDAHHRHRFDAQGLEIEPPQHLGATAWPTLGDVIREAHNLVAEAGWRST